MDPEILQDWGRRMRGLMGIVALLFAILGLRLFHLQVTTAADYAKDSEENRIAQKRVKAPRGLLLDRKGRVLARNRASYSLQLALGTRDADARAVAALEAVIGEPVTWSRRSGQRTVRLRRDVDFPTVAVVEERLRDDWPLRVEIEPQRLYPYGILMAHVVGYMGEVQDNEFGPSHVRRYAIGDYVGKTGIERTYDDSLRGADGVSYVEVNALYRVINERPFPDRERRARPGNDLRLTLDVDLQRAAYEALPDSLAGCAVVLDARTGAVLAMVSRPAFDPNVFVTYSAQDERRQLVQDEREPLLNRALRGTYAPGSTLKMVAAVAALEKGVTDTLSTFQGCSGSLRVGNVVFRCHNRDGHGELNVLEAIEASCNVYFLHLAQVLGIEAWHDYAARFGFGQPTGIDSEPSEMAGLLPDRRYHQQREGWSAGHLMNLVIGQGAMLVTPLQMARYVAALGNGGLLVTPHLAGEAPPPRRIAGVSRSTLDIVRKGMRRVVYGSRGTGRRAQVEGVELAGKSGTAQGPREDNDAWFVAFAPYDKPELAIAVLIEAGGGGGANAGPVAGAIVRAWAEGRAPPPSMALRTDAAAEAP